MPETAGDEATVANLRCTTAGDEATVLYVGVLNVIDHAIPLDDEGIASRNISRWTEPWHLVEALQELVNLFDGVQGFGEPHRLARGDVYKFRNDTDSSARFKIVDVDRQQGIAPSVCVQHQETGTVFWLALARLMRDYQLMEEEQDNGASSTVS